MSFEVKDRDLAARIGTLHTRMGDVETPCLMPVINPVKNMIPPCELREKFGFRMIITNSYLILKHFGEAMPDVHALTGFNGPIMTDSGAYQLLMYGGVDTNPKEIVEFQEKIRSDIGVILDTPTGGFATRGEAIKTVEETLRRAKESLSFRKDRTMLWAGPVQGGRHLDLVEWSAKMMGELDYDIHPLGSPVQIMEEYDYAQLVDMIVAAKKVLPPERPLHLFGAGHPMMLAIAVALGCDLFDSAAYALFAKDDRYMTATRTLKLEDLTELPCRCPVCTGTSLEVLAGAPKREREAMLARHNLYVTMEEMMAVKQAIREGTLWEHLEAKCRSHPKLYDAFKRLAAHSSFLEAHDPLVGRRTKGIFLYDSLSLSRPEVLRHRTRIIERYQRPPGRDVALLLPNPTERPFNKSPLSERIMESLKGAGNVHICFYGEPFGIVPSELAETYPLSQYESSVDGGTDLVEAIEKFIAVNAYRKVVVLMNGPRIKVKNAIISDTVDEACSEVLSNAITA
ncbi:MAG TPA: tRNA guanosine(15) transglycosylase TgtA [Candidatus Methanomethylicus sp.]|nr:tRNA guanosine(15) transglycosylase TgtA [Candidatus Methanomethylicus sp.]